jgi:hypothetical protein
MFVGRCYIIRARIITDITGLEGGVSVGEITASRSLVEAHQRPVLQGLTSTTRVGVQGGAPALLLLASPTGLDLLCIVSRVSGSRPLFMRLFAEVCGAPL